MLLWGTLATQFERPNQSVLAQWKTWLPNFMGIVLALYLFMADAIRVVKGEAPALRAMLPGRFNWPLFAIALLLIAAPVIENGLWIWRQKTSSNSNKEVQNEKLARLF